MAAEGDGRPTTVSLTAVAEAEAAAAAVEAASCCYSATNLEEFAEFDGCDRASAMTSLAANGTPTVTVNKFFKSNYKL